jgi:hypothetical protein
MDWGWFKKHSLLVAVIVFLLITLPSTVDSYWDLRQKTQAVKMHVNWWEWGLPILPILGVILFAILWRAITQNKKPPEIITSTTSLTDEFPTISSLLSQKEAECSAHLNTIETNRQTIEGQNKMIAELKERINLSEQITESIKELANIKPGDIIQGKTINVSLMFEQLKPTHLVLSDITFVQCTLVGPCIITLIKCSINGGNLGVGGKLDDVVIAVPPQGRRYFGIAGFLNCHFKFCTFKDVGFLLSKGDIENLKKNTTVLK